MCKCLIAWVLGLCWLAGGAMAQEDEPDALQPRFAEATPMVVVLRAVRDQSVETFRSAFSDAVRARVTEPTEWQEGLTFYTRRLAAFCEHPDDFEDITFVYEGDGEQGVLTVVYHGRVRFDVAVARDGFDWLIAEQ